jgi:hypothetical protein
MRVLKLAGLAMALVFTLTLCVRAAEKEGKEVTLKGTICCAKCELKLDGVKECATVIQVKDGDKSIVYFFDADTSKATMKEICKAGKKGTVKGTVSEKDGKKTITVSKDGVTFEK